MATTSSDPTQSYREHVSALKRYLDADAAARAAIGGEFLAIGTLEHQLLKSLGLSDDHFVVDVGCGSGRLAFQLKRYQRLRYLGIDVVPDLLDHAARITERPDWTFSVTEGFSIPAQNAEADFVCFFSVITHMLHEQSYHYLQEAYRVLKPGGCVVLSFLEFRIPCHWEQFQHSLRHPNAMQHLNQFIDRDAIAAWAQHIGFTVEAIADGDRPHIPLEDEVHFEGGQRMSNRGNLGQSVAVLRKPMAEQRALDTTYVWAPEAGALLQAEKHSPAVREWKSATSIAGRFACVSARGFVGHGHSVLIVGFVVADAEQRVLVRAVTATLVRHGITEVLGRPHLSVHDRSGKAFAENTGWASLSSAVQDELRAVIAKIGAEPLDPSGNDPALLLRLPPGDYTVMIHGRDGGTGLVVAEVCDIPEMG